MAVDALAQRHRRAFLVVLALALLARAALGLADTIAILHGGVPAIPMPDTVAVSPPSPLWPALFASLAFLGAIGLPGRRVIGWGLAVVACVSYLISGIVDLGLLRPGAPLGDPGFWGFFAANLVVPAVVLAALLGTRTWFVPARPRPIGVTGRWPRVGGRP